MFVPERNRSSPARRLYQREFLIPEGWLHPGLKCFLDLGAVRNVAQVILNGQDFGILWKPPFRVEVTSELRTNANRLEVKVTNLWRNRLIGDLRQPGNKPVTWTTYNPYGTSSELFDSGLIGPVKLEAAQFLEATP